MKLLFFNAVGTIGGAERVLLTLFKALKAADSDLHLALIVASPGPLVQAAEQLGVEVWTLPLPDSIRQTGDSQFKGRTHPFKKLRALSALFKMIPSLWNYLQGLRQTIQTIQPDLIHSNGIKTHILIALLGRLNIPVVWHIHDFYQSRPVAAKVLSWAKYSATQAIAISQAVADDAQTLLHPLPIRVIYNAIDLQRFVPAPSRCHDAQPLRIGLVATFARWKGHSVFLKAAAQVVQARTNRDRPVHFCIVGGPIYSTQGSEVSREELQMQIQQLQLENHVEFLGFQADMVPIYQSLDLVVHASTEPEPFGLVIVEAMACGKPVLVSQAGGAAELFTHDQDAIGVEPGNPTALAQALLSLIRDPQKRQQLGHQARQRAVIDYGCDRLSAELLAIYGSYQPVDQPINATI